MRGQEDCCGLSSLTPVLPKTHLTQYVFSSRHGDGILDQWDGISWGLIVKGGGE